MLIECVGTDDSTSSGTMLACQSEAAEATQKVESSAVVDGVDSKAEIHQLVNEAVKELLGRQEANDTKAMTDKIVAQVVEKLKPSVSSNTANDAPDKIVAGTLGKHVGVPSCVTKPSACVYNPTPISELKKRHIPVPAYMPTRENRVAAKRKSSSDVVTKPWLEMLRESSNSEMTYRPTAIVNPSQEPESSSKTYVPTLRSDNSSSNSYDDGNSNDYSGKVKEAYYPKSKKRREEYVPKKVKAPLKSVHQLEDAVLDDFEPEFNMIDEILTAAPESLINDVHAVMANENSEDLYDIEPKFSEDEEEEVEEVALDEPSTKQVQKSGVNAELIGEDATANEAAAKTQTDEIDKNKSRKSSRGKAHEEKSASSNRSKDKSRRYSTAESRDKKKERRDSSKSESKKKDSESWKKEHKTKEKSHDEKSSRDRNSKNESRDKHRHNSSSRRDKTRSSSPNKDKDKDKSKDSRNNDVKRISSHRSSRDTTSSSRKDKVPSSKSDDGKIREKSRHDSKHSSSSSSSSSKSKNSHKNESHKSNEKKQSSRSSSSHKSTKSSDKKSRNRKESSSETSHVEPDDRSNSPLENRFFNEELMETSDSDHDVEEECLKIFQVKKKTRVLLFYCNKLLTILTSNMKITGIRAFGSSKRSDNERNEKKSAGRGRGRGKETRCSSIGSRIRRAFTQAETTSTESSTPSAENVRSLAFGERSRSEEKYREESRRR